MSGLDLPMPVVFGIFIAGLVLIGIDVFLQKTGRVEPSPAKRSGTLTLRLIALALVTVALLVGVLFTS